MNSATVLEIVQGFSMLAMAVCVAYAVVSVENHIRDVRGMMNEIMSFLVSKENLSQTNTILSALVRDLTARNEKLEREISFFSGGIRSTVPRVLSESPDVGKKGSNEENK